MFVNYRFAFHFIFEAVFSLCISAVCSQGIKQVS